MWFDAPIYNKYKTPREVKYMAKAIMIQGTMSNVGKSLITAGLCRIFKQDGYTVAPFKSQNMALNSFITDDGLEMGRAQVMQAEASGIKPQVAMNPILLKPTNDTGSQVIVMGEVKGTMSASEYYKVKKSLIPDIMKAYNYIADNYDIVVIEGAGSPAEINLKADDIVNMGMAKMAKSPVILVGDIDRGGVFAQLIGTVNLLTPEEQNYVKAMLVNKFRGDKNILKPGIDMLEEMAGKPVVGVVPYIHCDIDDEDSLTERFNKQTYKGIVDIAVIRLPRISNFTDFNGFQCVEGVSLRYVEYADDIGDADIIIIPGTKNTIEDMLWMRENGIEAKIKQYVSRGKVLIGVCGGYQMLGQVIKDPEGSEHKGEFKAMGLLPTSTVFMSEKTRTRVKGKFVNVGGILKDLEGQSFEGYEIHMGISDITDNSSNMNVLINEEFGEKYDGCNLGNVYGTYVHGIFDCDNVVKTIVTAIMNNKGIDSSSVQTFNMKDYKERQYDLLADAIRNNVDMDMIYKILKEGV